MKKYQIRKQWGLWALIFSEGKFMTFRTFEEAVREMDWRIAAYRAWVSL